MIDVALKEWAFTCDLLAQGRLALLLRKGGIFERGGPGRFELEHSQFALMPSWAHQKPEMVKPVHRDAVQPLDEPESLPIRAWASCERIWQVPDRPALETLDDLHPWSDAQLDMRFNYKPDRPLYLMAIRVYRLSGVRTTPNRPLYAGCRSWAPLEADDRFPADADRPALSDPAFARIVQRVDGAFGTSAPPAGA